MFTTMSNIADASIDPLNFMTTRASVEELRLIKNAVGEMITKNSGVDHSTEQKYRNIYIHIDEILRIYDQIN